jgi:transcriptional regulator with XRE-family HTH domain
VDPDTTRRRRPGLLADLPSDLPPVRAAFVAELRRGRGEAGLNLADLARQTFSSKASVSRWLSGQALPTQEQASTWAQVCGTDKAAMVRLWEAAAALAADQDDSSILSAEDPATRKTPPADGPERSSDGEQQVARAWWPRSNHRALSALAVTALAAVAITAGTVALVRHLHHAAPCRAAYPVTLDIPSQTGSSVGITTRASCDLISGRTYLVMEELPNVDPKRNPHPVYYIKAQIPYLKAGQASSAQFILKEPVGTKAEFFVVSVDNAGFRALGQNQVVDNGILQLPLGTRQESSASWHLKGWQSP